MPRTLSSSSLSIIIFRVIQEHTDTNTHIDTDTDICMQERKEKKGGRTEIQRKTEGIGEV